MGANPYRQGDWASELVVFSAGASPRPTTTSYKRERICDANALPPYLWIVLYCVTRKVRAWPSFISNEKARE